MVVTAHYVIPLNCILNGEDGKFRFILLHTKSQVSTIFFECILDIKDTFHP